MIQAKIQVIVDYLQIYKDQIEDLYTWKPNIEGLIGLNVITKSGFAELNEEKATPFQKEVKLKKILSGELIKRHGKSGKNEEFDKLALWIIREWGGIKGGSDSETMRLVDAFLNAAKPRFERIASTSKVGSFLYPGKYIIYDSRVAYSLNWILLSQDAGKVFFPIPEGRNSRMQAFDVNVLIRLVNREKYHVHEIEKLKNTKFISTRDKELFVSKDDAYFEFNNVVKEVNRVLWNDERRNEPFYTEMLLFSLADGIIFKEITEKIRIGIVR